MISKYTTLSSIHVCMYERKIKDGLSKNKWTYTHTQSTKFCENINYAQFCKCLPVCILLLITG